jgi:hypothetical protein
MAAYIIAFTSPAFYGMVLQIPHNQAHFAKPNNMLLAGQVYYCPKQVVQTA